jgi:hypothetical protein
VEHEHLDALSAGLEVTCCAAPPASDLHEVALLGVEDADERIWSGVGSFFATLAPWR